MNRTATKTQHAVGDTVPLWTVNSWYPETPPRRDEYTLRPIDGGARLAWWHRSISGITFLADTDGTPTSPYVFLSAEEAMEWRVTELTRRAQVAEAQLQDALAERNRLDGQKVEKVAPHG